MRFLEKEDVEKMSKEEYMNACSYWCDDVVNVGRGLKVSELNDNQYSLVCQLLWNWLCSETNVVGPFAMQSSTMDVIERLGDKYNFDASEDDEAEQLIKHGYTIYRNISNRWDYQEFFAQFKSLRREKETEVHKVDLKGVYDNTI